MPVTQFEDPAYLEAVYAALFALLQTALPQTSLPAPFNILKFNMAERVVWVPDQVPVADQPALFQIQGPLHAEQREVFGPTKWIFTAVAVIFLRAEGTFPPSPLPAQISNYIVWALQSALGTTMPPYQKQTLGSLVYHVWIEGEVMSEVTEEQMVITVPINILPGPIG